MGEVQEEAEERLEEAGDFVTHPVDFARDFIDDPGAALENEWDRIASPIEDHLNDTAERFQRDMDRITGRDLIKEQMRMQREQIAKEDQRREELRARELEQEKNRTIQASRRAGGLRRDGPGRRSRRSRGSGGASTGSFNSLGADRDYLGL